MIKGSLLKPFSVEILGSQGSAGMSCPKEASVASLS